MIDLVTGVLESTPPLVIVAVALALVGGLVATALAALASAGRSADPDPLRHDRGEIPVESTIVLIFVVGVTVLYQSGHMTGDHAALSLLHVIVLVKLWIGMHVAKRYLSGGAA